MDGDLKSIHATGRNNFSSPPNPSPHRMPTKSVAQQLEELKSSRTRCISTSLPFLDYSLQNRVAVNDDAEPFFGGVSRGKVTDIYGPPGVGKTTMGIQLAANALKAGESVVWVDGSYQVSGHRISQIFSSKQSTSGNGQDGFNLQTFYDNLHHISTPTLAHFIAIFPALNPFQPPPNTSLIIIDSFSTLIACAFPRNADSNSAPKKPGEQNPSARKFAIIQILINALSKLAASQNLAIVILSQCATKMRSGAGAVLVPALNMKAWEQGLACRIALFKDFGWEDEEGNDIQDVRFAQVLKAEGTLVPEGRSKLVAFTILESGLLPIALSCMPISTPTFRSPMKRAPHPLSQFYNQNPTSTPNLPVLPQKRKFEDTGFEIPDSDDEYYGWDHDDEDELPPPPPQWQGSEDALGPGIDPEEEEEFEKDEELDELAEDARPVVADENTGGVHGGIPQHLSGGKGFGHPLYHDQREEARLSQFRAPITRLHGEETAEQGEVEDEAPPSNPEPGYVRDQEDEVEILSKKVPDLIPNSDSEDELAT